MDEQMRRAKDATPENAEITGRVLELAAAWEQGTIGRDSIRRQCTGYERFIATNHARGEDHHRLMAMLDALIAEDDARTGAIVTKHGRFERRDIEEARGLTTQDVNGRRVVQFPYDVDASGRPMYRVIPDHKLQEGQ